MTKLEQLKALYKADEYGTEVEKLIEDILNEDEAYCDSFFLNGKLLSEQSLSALYLKGIMRYECEEYDEAESVLSEIPESHHNYYDAVLIRSRMFYDNDDNEVALELYNGIPQSSDKYFEAQHGIALVHCAQADYQIALDVLNSIPLNDNNFENITDSIALVYREMDDKENEMESYDKVSAINPAYGGVVQISKVPLIGEDSDIEGALSSLASIPENDSNQLEKPLLFTEHNFGSEKPKYKWYEGINIRFMEMRNDKLFNRLIKINCKAATGISIAACEWVLWRLEGWREKDIELQKQYIQALWTSLISKEYLSKEKVDSELGNIYTQVGEPIELINSDYGDLKKYYINHHPYIYYVAVNMLELARYVSDDKDFFDEWFNTIITKSTELFPVPTDDLDSKGIFKYNNSDDFDPYLMVSEPFIPREFYFEPDFDYQTANLKQLQQKLLDSVDCKENPFLSSPERMIDIDFVGVPYKVND